MSFEQVLPLSYVIASSQPVEEAEAQLIACQGWSLDLNPGLTDGGASQVCKQYTTPVAYLPLNISKVSQQVGVPLCSKKH